MSVVRLGCAGCGLALLVTAGCDRPPAGDVALPTVPSSVASADAPSSAAITSVPLAPPAPGAGGTLFEMVPPEASGVAFESRFEWEHPQRHLYAHGYAGGGVTVGDVDGDGRPDLYLVSQTGRDRLYRQTGDLRFEDVTTSAGVDHAPTWGCGAAFADIDGDGDLDLYVCNYDAPNRLYCNDGAGRFTEDAQARGLDVSVASVMAAFADYDGDGDLDAYLVTNRLYPGFGRDQPATHHVDGKVRIAPGYEEAFAIQERPIGGEIQKFVVKAGQRDRLFRNDGSGRFTDVSAEAGITGRHPGLSATWWDDDLDGRPDLYVTNDFWDPDRLYRNQGDGTFRDVLAEAVPHTPWFSMGADFGDLDNDGLPDFVAADMSATSHYMSKIMMGDMNESRWFLESAEPRQYMRNAVYRNTGTGRFMEIGFLANLASTDWTWSVKLGDYDNDGLLDAFFTNGTANHSFDPDLTRELRELESRQNQQRLRDPRRRWEEQWRVYRTRPPRREANIAMRNLGDLAFEPVSAAWGLDHVGISFGAARTDLDRDGDLDLVVSNVDDPVTIYRNTSTEGSRLLVRLRGVRSSREGIGATVTVRTAAGTQMRQIATTRGYMSSDEALAHFGLGPAERVQALEVRWPTGVVQRFADLAAGHLYTITEPAAGIPEPAPTPAPTFDDVTAATGLAAGFRPEPLFDDYRQQPLLPARHSQLGPGLAWGDADGDGDDDLYVGGAAGQAGRLMLNDGNARFTAARSGPWAVDRRSEDLAALWIDADADGDLDLYVASGGVEAEAGDATYRDRLYVNDGGGGFSLAPPGALPDARDSTGTVVAADWDRDGDLDLFVGARVVPGAYPTPPTSRLLRNDGAVFVDVTAELAPALARIGMVTSALFSDVDGDDRVDLLVAVEWGPVSLWLNRDGAFVDATAEAGLADRLGWWTSIAGSDLDRDGDIDYVVMNAGLNTKYRASPEKPALLYAGDLDGSGRRQLVEAKPDHDHLVPVRGRSCSSEAMPFVARKLPTYDAFARARLDEIYDPDRLEQAEVWRATHLESGVLINETLPGSAAVRLAYRSLPRIAQVSPGYGAVASDLDGDANPDVFVVQNEFGREPETGRWDGGMGQLLRGDGRGGLVPVSPATSGLVVTGDATALTLADLDDDGRPDLVAARNDRPLVAYRHHGPGAFLAVRLQGRPGNPLGAGARVTAVHEDGTTQTSEVHAGSGYLSQSAPWLFFGQGRPGAGIREVRIRWPGGASSTHPVGPDAAPMRIPAPQASREPD